MWSFKDQNTLVASYPGPPLPLPFLLSYSRQQEEEEEGL